MLKLLNNPPHLASPPPVVEVTPSSLLDEDCELVVEAEVGAVTRLGMFIGEKVGLVWS